MLEASHCCCMMATVRYARTSLYLSMSGGLKRQTGVMRIDEMSTGRPDAHHPARCGRMRAGPGPTGENILWRTEIQRRLHCNASEVGGQNLCQLLSEHVHSARNVARSCSQLQARSHLRGSAQQRSMGVCGRLGPRAGTGSTRHGQSLCLGVCAAGRQWRSASILRSNQQGPSLQAPA